MSSTTIEAIPVPGVSAAAAPVVVDDAKAKAFHAKFSESKSALITFVGGQYSDLGEQYLVSGGMAYELCKLERDFFGSAYNRDYYKRTLAKCEDEILIFTRINPNEIRLDYRLRCYLLRECLAAVPNIGAELAQRFTYWELKDVVLKALDFKVESLSYALADDWQPFFNEIADRRRRGEHVTSADFEKLYNDRCKFLADKAKESGKQSAKDLENEVRKHNAKLARKRQDVSTAILGALADNAMSPADVVDSLRSVAEQCKVTVDARTVGYSPKNFTRTDCGPFTRKIYKSGPDGAKVLAQLVLDSVKVLLDERRFDDAGKIIAAAQERFNRAVSDEANPIVSGTDSGPVVKKIKPKSAEELRPTGS